MFKTPEYYKREDIKRLFERILKEEKIELSPHFIKITESFEEPETKTRVKFEFFQNDKLLKLQQDSDSGLVDCLFSALQENYEKDFHSISNIKLVNLSVTPMMNTANRYLGPDAKVSLDFRVEIADHSPAEFSVCSRSIISCAMHGVLKVFQFYLNCHKTFVKLRQVIDDAKERNRTDIIQLCMRDISSLTDVNTYYEKTI